MKRDRGSVLESEKARERERGKRKGGCERGKEKET